VVVDAVGVGDEMAGRTAFEVGPGGEPDQVGVAQCGLPAEF